MADPVRVQVVSAVGLLTVVVIGGGAAIWMLSGYAYSLFDSIYFALYTVSTVGYGELENMDRVTRAVTMAIMVAGIASIAFFQSTLTTMFVEGAIGKAFRRRRMEKRIASLAGHTIVVGCGRTGAFVVSELAAMGRPFVVIDASAEALENLNEELRGKMLYVVGDATDDHVLVEAGIERASGLVAVLTDDPDNLFVTVTARSLNPTVRIVSKALTLGNEAKLERAGANATVSPHRIGGLRLATELLRPHTAEFLDSMMSGSGEGQLRFEDVEVRKGAPFEGASLKDAPIRSEANVLVVALRRPTGEFVYNPPAEQRLEAGAYVVVLGPGEGIRRMREMLGSSEE